MVLCHESIMIITLFFRRYLIRKSLFKYKNLRIYNNICHCYIDRNIESNNESEVVLFFSSTSNMDSIDRLTWGNIAIHLGMVKT